MWRSIFCLVMALPLLAQTVPPSLLSVEEDAGRHILQFRNNYSAAAVCIVMGHMEGNRYRQTRRYDVSLSPVAQPLEPGATRDLDDGSLDFEFWQPLAVIFADGTYAGSPELIESLVQGHEIVSQEIDKAIEILTSNPNAAEAIESWSRDAMKPHVAEPWSRRWVPGVIGPIMAQMSVPRYVRSQLKKGITQAEIIQALKDWQARVQKYRLDVAFV